MGRRARRGARQPGGTARGAEDTRRDERGGGARLRAGRGAVRQLRQRVERGAPAGQRREGPGTAGGGQLGDAGESIAPATRDEAANNSAERHALAELRRLTDEGKVFETDENGQIRTSDEYEAALARYNAAKEAGPQDNQKTVLTDENSAGMRLYHEGGENLAKAQAGLGSAARFERTQPTPLQAICPTWHWR